MPWAERPAELPLNVEECRTAIWRCRGNITEAAQLLKITASRLRSFVKKSAYLSAEMQEAKEALVDIAEEIVYEALTDGDDAQRRDQMARYVLSSQGKARGWGSGKDAPKNGSVTINNITVSWGDGSMVSGPPANDQSEVIEHDPVVMGGES